ncbi:unnamed protein product, partial [Phaeothamnion confervicola]
MRGVFDTLASPLKALVTSALQAQLAKYIHNVSLEELTVHGLLGGDVVLEDLEIRRDVLQEILRVPTHYDVARGYIKELRVHIPWTRLQSRPIEIKFHTIEIIVVPSGGGSVDSGDGGARRRSRKGEDPVPAQASSSSWMQLLLMKALANVSIAATNLVLKLEDADVVLSASL